MARLRDGGLPEYTKLDAKIAPAGWLEWQHDDKPSLPTVYYAEYEFVGTRSGARSDSRDPHSHQLTSRGGRPSSRAKEVPGRRRSLGSGFLTALGALHNFRNASMLRLVVAFFIDGRFQI